MRGGATKRDWWGTFELPEGRGGIWRIGPLSLWIVRQRDEWRIITEQGKDRTETSAEVSCPAPAFSPPESAASMRLAWKRREGELFLCPALPDRAIVTRPDTPFCSPAGDEVTIYISTPLWVRISMGQPSQIVHEAPTSRLKETWFGPDSRTGELCYFDRTSARLDLDALPTRPSRALTALRLENHTDLPFLLEHMKLPVPYLSLFRDRDGRLWTEKLTVERTSAGPMPVRLSDGPPEEAIDPVRVAGPRLSVKENVLLRAFNALVD